MCARRRKRNPNASEKIEIKRMKQGCCTRCRRKICRWLGRKLERCVKKKVFGVPDPHLSDYEVAGMSYGRIMNKFKRTNNLSKLELNPSKFGSKKSIVTLFRQHLSKAKIAIKNIDLIEGLAPKDLKKKFSIKGSRAKILENMLDDYKGGKLSLTWPSHKSAVKSEKLDKEMLHRMLSDYDETRKKKVDASLKNFLTNADDLKRKFSLTWSKEKVLDKMVNDYKTGAVSLSMLPNKYKLDPKKMDKEQITKVLDDYAELRKEKDSLFKISRFKQFQSVIKDVKNVSLTGLSKLWFKT